MSCTKLLAAEHMDDSAWVKGLEQGGGVLNLLILEVFGHLVVKVDLDKTTGMKLH